MSTTGCFIFHDEHPTELHASYNGTIDSETLSRLCIGVSWYIYTHIYISHFDMKLGYQDLSQFRLCLMHIPMVQQLAGHLQVIFVASLQRSARIIKSYQLVQSRIGRRALGKSSILALPELSISATFHCFGAVRLEQVQFLYCADF